MSLHVIVIGAGAIGASIAARLAERGTAVTLVDRSAPGTGTSSTSFAWINSNSKEPYDYFAINRAGMQAHQRLAGSSEWLVTNGHVEIAVADDHRDRLTDRVERLRGHDYPVELLSEAQAQQLIPDVRMPEGIQLIAHFPDEGHAYPALYIADALGRARAGGVRELYGNAVVALDEGAEGAEVRLADGTTLKADVVVSATGRWTGEIASLAGVDVPMLTYSQPGDETVGYLATTNPLPVRLSRVVTAPDLNLRPNGGGRLLLQALDLDATADPHDAPAVDSPLAGQLVQRLRALMPGTTDARIEHIVVGRRAIPGDGRTVAGRVDEMPWLYAVATHSGITLAPFLGEAVADEILGTERVELDAFRPGRFRVGTPYILTGAPRHPGEQ